MKSVSKPSLIVLYAVLFAFPVVPQTITVPGETIEVSIVNLDVVVTDKKGNRIYGLPRDAFEVMEDGKPQPITNFSELRQDEVVAETSVHSAATAAPVAAPAQQLKRQPRIIAVFIDQLQLPASRTGLVFDGLNKLFRETVQAGDAVMIASWNHRLVTRLNPTDDLSAISRTLDAIAKESIGAQFDRINDMRARQAATAQFQTEAKGRAPSADDDVMLFEARAAAEIALYEIRQKITAIKVAVTSISAFEGKRMMILMTDRLGEYAGAENFYANSPTLTPTDRNRYDTRAFTAELIATANAAGVTLYPLYPEGTEWTVSDASVTGHVAMPTLGAISARTTDYDVLVNEMASLNTMATQTGGIAAAGPTDIVKMLPRIRDDFGSYYSLAYRVPSNRRGQSHTMVVKTNNSAYLVRSRRQFVEKSDDALMRDHVVANLLRGPASSGIAVSVSAGATVQTKKHLYSIPIVVKVPKASLTMIPGDGTNHGAFKVYVAPGRVLGYAGEVWTVTLPFSAKSETRSGVFAYKFDLITDFATDKLSVGVIDDNSHDTGFARIDLPTSETK